MTTRLGLTRRDNGRAGRRRGWRLSLVLGAGLVLAGCRTTPPAPLAPPAQRFTQRGQWEVWRQGEGPWHAVVCTLVAEGRVYLAETASLEPREWATWLALGANGAAPRLTRCFDATTGAVVWTYDHVAHQRATALPPAAVWPPAGQRLASGIGVAAPLDLPAAELPPLPKAWLSFYGDAAKLDDPTLPAKQGLKLTMIGAFSAAEAAGLLPGDVLIRVAPYDYNAPFVGNYVEVHKTVYRHYQVGDKLTVEFLRPTGEKTYERRTGTCTVPNVPGWDQPVPPAFAAYVQAWGARPATPTQQLQELMAAQYGCTAEIADLRQRLATLHRTVDGCRLAPVMAAALHPYQFETLARELSDALPAASNADRWPRQVAWLDRVYLTDNSKFALPADVRDWRGTDFKGHGNYLADLLRVAAACQEEAFAGLTADERKFMELQTPALLEGLVDSRMMSYDRDRERQRGNIKLLQLAPRVNVDALVRQALVLSRMLDPEFLASIQKLAAAAPKQTGTLFALGTKWGRIVINGTDNDRYVGGAGDAVILDLGGNDYYANNTGSSVPGKLASAVLIDLAGNDQYENPEPFRQGCGYFGVGLLADLGGDDEYLGGRFCQGAGLFGIGLLYDRAGRDQYAATDYAQGVGQVGAGILVDDAGPNEFRAQLLGQGVGLARGVGVLFSTDPAGNDIYMDKGRQGSSYGDAGSFEGWGQGIGIGHRHFASGGVGLLVDQGGNDRYAAGTFSQGGGYFFGLGLLHDRAGNDHYQGSRYNQGFTAHQAIGAFLDDAGNDDYYTPLFVAMGLAWDESVTIFTDRAGDDRYQGNGHLFGVGSMNGLTLFTEGGGSDRFSGGRPGENSGNSYHGGCSLGFFLDLGAGEDEFGKGRERGAVAVDKDFAFFADVASVEAALAQLRQTPLTRPPPPAPKQP